MLESLRCAVRGVALVFRSQRNARIHAGVAAAVVAAGVWLGLTRAEWCWIVLAIVAVWAAEASNTAVERLTDLVSPARHPLAGQAKDVAAGAVLITAAGAALIGLIVLGPHVLAVLPGAAGR